MPTLIQHACFTCRKVFKKPYADITSLSHQIKPKDPTTLQRINVHKCPQCGEDMILMDYKFRAPAKDDIAEWKWIEKCVTTGTDYSNRTIRKVKPKPKVSPQLRIALGVYGKRRPKAAKPTAT